MNMSTTTRTIPYRRRREDKTNYKKRLKLLMSNKPRLVIRKSLKNILVQLVEFHPKGDKILVSASTKELKKHKWGYTCGNIPSAYLIGLLAGKRAIAKKYKDAIIDLGLQNPSKGTRLYAAVKGAIDAGMKIPHEEDIFPSVERIQGQHITNNPLNKEKKFNDMTKAFEECKEQITKE